MTLVAEELTSQIVDKLMLDSLDNFESLFTTIDGVIYKYFKDLVGETIEGVFDDQESLQISDNFKIIKGFGMPYNLKENYISNAEEIHY